MPHSILATHTYSKIISTFAGAILGGILVFGEGWTPSSGIIASYGVFDLDHICSVSTDQHQVLGILWRVDLTYPKSPKICVQYG